MTHATKARHPQSRHDFDNLMAAPSGKVENGQRTNGFTEVHRDTNRRRAEPVDIYALPPELEALLLIREYFGTVGLFLPCVHQDTFLDTYKKARADNYRHVRRSWLGLLNIIFATASTTLRGAKPMEQRLKDADAFYRRSLGLASNQILVGTSLETSKKSRE